MCLSIFTSLPVFPTIAYEADIIRERVFTGHRLTDRPSSGRISVPIPMNSHLALEGEYPTGFI